MHVLVAPDRIGTCSATQVAAAIAAGWRRYDSTTTLDVVPLSDGGPGPLDALAAAQVGERCELAGGPVLRSVDGTVYVEPALATGRVDELLAAVLAELDPSRVVVGVGGSTADRAGDLAADRLHGWPATVPLAVAADAEPTLSSLGSGWSPSAAPGSVAPRRWWTRWGWPTGAAAADLVVTAETVFDDESLPGRVPRGAAWAAQRAGCPCVVLAGRVMVGRREFSAAGVDAAYAVEESAGSLAAARRAPGGAAGGPRPSGWRGHGRRGRPEAGPRGCVTMEGTGHGTGAAPVGTDAAVPRFAR